MNVRDAILRLEAVERADMEGSVSDFNPMLSFEHDEPSFLLGDTGTTGYAARQFASKSEMRWGTLSDLFRRRELLPKMASEYSQACINESRHKKILVRKINHVVAGVLSDRYAIIDNLDVMRSLAVSIEKIGAPAIHLMSDEKLFVARVMYKSTQQTIRVGDDLIAGVDITNSEVGFSAFRVVPMVYRIVCANGMRAWVKAGDSFQKVHLGGGWSADNSEIVEGALHKAFDMISDIRSLVSAVIDNVHNTTICFKVAEGKKISNNVAMDAQQVIAKSTSITAWDVVNAFTLVAKMLPISERVSVEEAMGSMANVKSWDNYRR